jgi:4'-phosphopantetheinyl transferase
MSPAVELERHQAHVWIARPEAMRQDALEADYRAILSSAEKARLDERPQSTRNLYLVTRALVRWSLSQHADVAPESWAFATSGNGKPEIAGPLRARGLRFNVSHTDSLVVCAVALERELGVDVENQQSERRFLQVAERFFAPVEARAVRDRSDAERAEIFFHYWTLKEAYIKARGVGFSQPLSQFWFELEADAAPRIRFGREIADDPAAWQFWQRCVDDRHVVALAIQRADARDLEVVVHEATPLSVPVL